MRIKRNAINYNLKTYPKLNSLIVVFNSNGNKSSIKILNKLYIELDFVLSSLLFWASHASILLDQLCLLLHNFLGKWHLCHPCLFDCWSQSPNKKLSLDLHLVHIFNLVSSSCTISQVEFVLFFT